MRTLSFYFCFFYLGFVNLSIAREFQTKQFTIPIYSLRPNLEGIYETTKATSFRHLYAKLTMEMRANCGEIGKMIRKVQFRFYPKNHRFRQVKGEKTMTSFPKRKATLYGTRWFYANSKVPGYKQITRQLWKAGVEACNQRNPKARFHRSVITPTPIISEMLLTCQKPNGSITPFRHRRPIKVKFVCKKIILPGDW